MPLARERLNLESIQLAALLLEKTARQPSADELAVGRATAPSNVGLRLMRFMERGLP